jgi:uncharacterized protein (TIGR00251 family)
MLKISEKSDGLTFKLVIQPRSSTNKLMGFLGDALKIKLTAPPVDNAANKQCIAFLACCLKVPKARLTILSGHSSKIKKILLRYPESKTAEDKKRLRQKIMHLLHNLSEPEPSRFSKN